MWPDKGVLAYTVAIDPPGEFLYRNLAKLMVSSLLRSGFLGSVVIFHNGESPLYHIPRSQVTEELVTLNPEGVAHIPDKCPNEEAWSLKHQVASVLLTEHQWQKLLFIDADCIVTGPLDIFWGGAGHLAITREREQPITLPQFNCFLSDQEMEGLRIDGINSGVYCVDRSIAEEFFAAWSRAEAGQVQRRRCCTDQAALNRAVLDHNFELFDCGQAVHMPFHTDIGKRRPREAVITHWVGAMGVHKLRASFGLFMERYYFDPALTLFNLMEA